MKLNNTAGTLQGLPLRYSPVLAGLVFGALAALPAHANVLCEKGKGDTEIQCIARGATSTDTLSVTSILEVPVTVLVTQWAGKCGHSEPLVHTDSRSVRANATLSIPFHNVAGSCRTALFSECSYTELTPSGSVQKAFDCGALLDVKGQ